MRQTCGSGAAKVILLGEHAVVHGAPALALALAEAIGELALEPLTFRATRRLHSRTLIEKQFSIAANVAAFEEVYASLV